MNISTTRYAKALRTILESLRQGEWYTAKEAGILIGIPDKTAREQLKSMVKDAKYNIAFHDSPINGNMTRKWCVTDTMAALAHVVVAAPEVDHDVNVFVREKVVIVPHRDISWLFGDYRPFTDNGKRTLAKMELESIGWQSWDIEANFIGFKYGDRIDYVRSNDPDSVIEAINHGYMIYKFHRNDGSDWYALTKQMMQLCGAAKGLA